MQKRIINKAGSGFLAIAALAVLGCGSAVNVPVAEGKFMMVKNESVSSPSATGGAGISMRSLWTVSGYKMGDNPLWTEKDARAMLFKSLDMTETTIIFDGKTCRDVTFQRETLKAKEYLASAFHTTPEALGIAEETLEVVKTNCDLPGFDQYLRLQERRIVIQLNGVFLFFESTINY
ncbi:MAG TPA: hypothetical protein DCR95_10175 [Desulfobacter sp.]|jgi:hypothetical protein|nr:hypothetical protein [Desulfobacter sp.]